MNLLSMMTKYFKFKKSHADSLTGFTLIELVMVISIMTIIMGIIFFNHSAFNDQIAVTNLAYDVALSVRQAQISGVSVKEVSSGSRDFDKSYGVYFNMADQVYFVSFLDGVGGSPGDHMYNGSAVCDSSNPECQEVFTIKRGNKIKEICAMDAGEGRFCNVQKLDVTFRRPNPDAVIYTDGSPLDNNYRGVVVRLVSPKDIIRSIVIDRTGQISIPSSN